MKYGNGWLRRSALTATLCGVTLSLTGCFGVGDAPAESAGAPSFCTAMVTVNEVAAKAATESDPFLDATVATDLSAGGSAWTQLQDNAPAAKTAASTYAAALQAAADTAPVGVQDDLALIASYWENYVSPLAEAAIAAKDYGAYIDGILELVEDPETATLLGSQAGARAAVATAFADECNGAGPAGQ